MDANGQKNHLRAYGVVFAAMREGIVVEWLLNYKGGSFAMDNVSNVEELCSQNGVTCKEMSDNEYYRIIKLIKAAGFNGQVIKLDKAPRIAVYTPLNKEPWDDAVTMVLTYAGIPFDKIYADEVLEGDLEKYDWLHLHHEDFTGEYSKFWANYHNTLWYRNDKVTMESLAAKHGFEKVAQLQGAVVKKIREFVRGGGNMFAMCTATETFDIALAAAGVDICDTPYDGDPPDPHTNEKLNYENCLAFKSFKIVTDPYLPTHSDIDFTSLVVPEQYDYFALVTTSAKLDPVASMLSQDHVSMIKGFMGQTTAFREELLKKGTLILGKNIPVKTGTYPNCEYNNKRVKYIHGSFGKGTWTFYGGHDPECYKHLVGSAPPDLSLFPNSPGYRLILNNLLLPAAKNAIKQDVHTAVSTENIVEAKTIIDNLGSKMRMYTDSRENELIIINETIETPRTGNQVTVIIATLSGNEIINQSYNTKKIRVDIKELPAGMYQVKVDGQYMGKIVKE